MAIAEAAEAVEPTPSAVLPLAEDVLFWPMATDFDPFESDPVPMATLSPPSAVALAPMATLFGVPKVPARALVPIATPPLPAVPPPPGKSA
jgi:hypothetical protein